MSNYPSMPAPPPSDQYGHQGTTEQPQSIKTAVNIVWAVVALSVIGTILVFVFLDDVVDAGGTGLSSAQLDAVRSAAIVGAIIGFLVFGVLWVVLGIFLRKGANWARIVLTVLASLGLIFGLFGLLTGSQPAILMILTVIQLGLYVALLYFMWRKESSIYLTSH